MGRLSSRHLFDAGRPAGLMVQIARRGGGPEADAGSVFRISVLARRARRSFRPGLRNNTLNGCAGGIGWSYRDALGMLQPRCLDLSVHCLFPSSRADRPLQAFRDGPAM